MGNSLVMAANVNATLSLFLPSRSPEICGFGLQPKMVSYERSKKREDNVNHLGKYITEFGKFITKVRVKNAQTKNAVIGSCSFI